MKSLVAGLTVVAFLAGSLGMALAQGTSTPAPAEKKAEKAGDKMEKKAEKKPAAKSARGTVKSASTDSLVVSGKEKGKDAEWTFALDSKTAIKKSGKTVAAGDLKAGDRVQVRYMEQDGKATATSVTVRGAEKAAAAKKDDKKPAGDAAAKPAEKKP